MRTSLLLRSMLSTALVLSFLATVSLFSTSSAQPADFSSMFKATASSFFLFAPQATGPETVDTFESDCTTPENVYILGETVCAVANNAPPPFLGNRQRRFQWIAPDNTVVRQVDITTPTQSDSYTIPMTGPQAQVGTWTIRLIKNNGTTAALTRFLVRDPNNLRADLAVTKTGPLEGKAGANATYLVTVTNNGPDDAQNVSLTDDVPANTTFVSATQSSGATFNCTNPAVGSSGTTTCTRATLARGASASFTLVYEISSGTPVGTRIFNRADVTSQTVELEPSNNHSTAPVTVTGTVGGGDQCVVSCPADITVPHETGVAGATVTYPAPTTTGSNCGAVTSVPASGTFFPVGTTTVVVSAETGDPCSFNVTVEDTVAPTISCPSDITVAEDAGTPGSAIVTYTTPTASDDTNSVTVSCDRPSGSSFPVGTTTVTCTALDAGFNEATCSFTVTVTGTSCELSCPSNIVVNAPSGACGAIVNYPAPTATACGSVTSTPASGTFFRAGTTTVTVTTSSGASCEFTVTVLEHTPPVVVAPAPTTANADASCHGFVPDYLSNLAASDNCTEDDFLIKSQTPTSGTPVGPGVTNVSISVTDSSNNTTTVNTTFTVNDVTPPVLTVNGPNPMTVECHTSFTDPGATATDNCGATVTSTNNVNVNVPGTYTVNYSATDGTNTVTATRTVNVVDTLAPTITLNGANPMTVECHTSYTEPGATATDQCAGNLPVTITGTVNVNVPGTYTRTYTASDGAGHTTTATRTVNVVDTTAPTITLNGQTIELWPPNHKYQTVTVTNLVASASDGCDGTIDINDVVISKVTSDELENSGGDGNTLNDIVIAANCKSVQLRSERDGGGDGRVYTITFRVKDAAGNTTTKTAKVTVPKSQGNNGTAVDSGVHYTVNGTCP